MRIPIFLQIFLLIAMILVAVFWVGYEANNVSVGIIMEHEQVDLRDEAVASQGQITSLFDQLALSGRELAASDVLHAILLDEETEGDDEASDVTTDALRQQQLVGVLSDWLDQPHLRTLDVIAIELLRAPADGSAEANPLAAVAVEKWDTPMESLLRRDIDALLESKEATARRIAPVPVAPSERMLGRNAVGPFLFGWHPPHSEGGKPIPIVTLSTMFTVNGRFRGQVRQTVDLREWQRRLSASPRHVTLLVDSAGRPLLGTGVGPDSPRRGSGSVDDLLPADIREGNARQIIFEVDSAEDTIGNERLPGAERFDHWFLIGYFPKQGTAEELGSVHVRAEEAALRLDVENPDKHVRYFSSSSKSFSDSRFVVSASDPQILAGLADTLEDLGLAIDSEPQRTEAFVVQHVRVPLPYLPLAASPGLIRAASREESRADIEQKIWAKMFWALLLLLAFAPLLSLIGTQFVTSPLKRLERGVRRVKEGIFQPVKVDRRTLEIANLSESFNEMVETIRQRNTELDQTNRELNLKEVRTRTILDLAAEAILIVSGEGTVMSCNRAAQECFGWSESEAEGKPIDEFIDWQPSPVDAEEPSPAELRASLMVNISGQNGVLPGLVGRRRNGSQFAAEAAISRVVLPMMPLSYTLIVRDITEQLQQRERLEAEVARRTAALQKANADLRRSSEDLAKNQQIREMFLQSVNHDLRNPLMAISGYARQLRRSELTPAQEKRVNSIGDALHRIERLVNDLRDYQTILQGEATPEPTEFKLSDVFEAITAEVEPRTKANGVTLEFRIDPAIDTLFTDQDWTHRIVGNLVTNACKFTRDGTVQCHARLQEVGGREEVVIEVTDQGRGLSPEEQEKLFHPYEKIVSREENPDGTGLGLVICRGLCQTLGGYVGVDPERTALGEGATFVAKLPKTFRRGQAEPESVAQPGVEANGKPGRNLALVIDDDRDVCQLLEGFLTEHGFQVVVGYDGEEGLRLAQERKPTVITLDAQLPKLDGWRVLQELKSNPETASIPVIMASIFNRPAKGFALGADDYINKPIDWDYFGQVIDRYHNDERGPTVLVVDDDADCRAITREELEQRGCQILTAIDGDAALSVLATTQPDLIVTDLVMPNMDGFEFVAKLKDDPQWRTIPVIVLTGKELTGEERHRFDGCVGEVIEKRTLAWDRLREQIAEYIDRVTPSD